jgi:hypothetical protein
MFKVSQVRNPHNHSQLGATGQVIRTETVGIEKVSTIREALREGMRTDPAASSDVIQVTEV